MGFSKNKAQFVYIGNNKELSSIVIRTLNSSSRLNKLKLKEIFRCNNDHTTLKNLITFKKRIDIVLLEFGLNRLEGFDLLRIIRLTFPQVQFIILADFSKPEEIASVVIEKNVRAYIDKSEEISKLSRVIHSVLTKGYFYDENVTLSLLLTLQTLPFTNLVNNKSTGLTIKLSKKELTVLREFATDFTYKEIAEKLNISPRTVDGYREILFNKLGVKSRVGCVIHALKENLIQIS